MNEYKLTKMDYEDIDKLLIIADTIRNHYQDLCLLELQNKKNTEEFDRVIERLKSSLSLENNIFNNLTLTFEKADSILEYLSRKYNITELSLYNNFDNHQQIDATRECYRLFNYLNKCDRKNLPNFISKNYHPTYNEDKVRVLNQLELSALTQDISTLLNDDLLNLILSIEKNRISNLDKVYDYDLLNIYLSCFIYENVEEIMLENRFKLKEYSYSYLNGIISLYKLPVGLIKSIQEYLCCQYFSDVMDNLFNNTDINNLYYIESILRSILAFLSQEGIEKMKKSFSFSSSDSKDRLIEMINDSFNHVEEDKKLIRTIYYK